MCWVNILFLFFIFSCHLCFFSCFFFYKCIYSMSLVGDYGTLVLGQRFIWESSHPHALVLRVLLFFTSSLLFMMYRMWLPQQLVSTILVWIRLIGPVRVNLSSLLKLYFICFSIYSIAWVCEQTTNWTSLYKLLTPAFTCFLPSWQKLIKKMAAVWPQCIFPSLHDWLFPEKSVCLV